MFRKCAVTSLICFVAATSTPILAQGAGDDVRREIEELKKGQQEIQRQLAEIKKLLESRPQPRRGPNVKDVVFRLGAHPVKGDRQAALTMIEFTDYQ